VGLEGLSVERIARGAGLDKTSVYRRWPTREALVAAALEGVLEAVAARAGAGRVAPGVKPERLLGALVGAVIHRVMLEHEAASPRWLASLVDLTQYGALPR